MLTMVVGETLTTLGVHILTMTDLVMVVAMAGAEVTETITHLTQW